MLQELVEQAPSDKMTVRWLLQRLDRSAFGIVILLLAVIGMVPGVCIVVAILLLIPASEMILGRVVPTFPGWIADRPFPTRYLATAVQRAAPVLRQVGKAIRPRWRLRPDVTKRIVGVVTIVMAVLLVIPIPMIQVIPASITIVVALAYIEDDGALLALGCLAAIGALTTAGAAIWGLALGADWIGRLI